MLVVFPVIQWVILAHTANTGVEAEGKLILPSLVLLLHFCPRHDVHLLAAHLDGEVDLVLVEMCQDGLGQILESLRLLTVLRQQPGPTSVSVLTKTLIRPHLLCSYLALFLLSTAPSYRSWSSSICSSFL